MSNSSLPSPSPCGSWPWVIIHTFPHSLSPFLSLSLLQCEEDSSFLPSFFPSFLRQRPSHREPQQNTLPPMTHSPTSKAPLHTTSHDSPPHHTQAWIPVLRGLLFAFITLGLLACLCLFLCLTVCLVAIFCIRLYSCCLVRLSLFTCLLTTLSLTVFPPACTLYLHTSELVLDLLCCLPACLTNLSDFLLLSFSLSPSTQLQSQNIEGHGVSPLLSAC